MTTLANMSGFTFKLLSTSVSPNALVAIEEVLDVAGMGSTSPTLDVTNWDSAAGTKEYIAARAEGSEFTVTCNFVPNATGQRNAMAQADAKVNVACELRYTNSSPQRRMAPTVACQGYTWQPGLNDQNKIVFSYKISGSLNRV